MENFAGRCTVQEEQSCRHSSPSIVGSVGGKRSDSAFAVVKPPARCDWECEGVRNVLTLLSRDMPEDFNGRDFGAEVEAEAVLSR